MTTAIGQFRHVVALLQPGAGTPDPDGGWGGDAWDPLDPPIWHCSIQAASLRDLQRLSGGVLSTTATHVLRGRYHPQLTRTARIQFRDRVFDVESVHDLEERRIELEVIVHEQLGAEAVAPPAPAYADLVIADGAGAYWRLDDRGGTTAIDSVGFAHGTISAGVTLNQPGALMDGNAAMAFNGTTGQVVTAVTVPLPAVASVECWLKTTVGGLPLICWGSGETPALSVAAQGTLQIYDGNAGLAAGLIPVHDGQFHHGVFVFNGTTVAFYVDGVFDRALSYVRPLETFIVALGRNLAYPAGNNAGFFSGVLDEVAIYPLALTAAQIAAHYAARNGT